MTEIKLESDVPMPPHNANGGYGVKNPIRGAMEIMEVHQSFLIEEKDRPKAANFRHALKIAKGQSEKKFAILRDSHDKTKYRVWRAE